MRHGDADAEIPEGLGDEARALTAKARHALTGHFAALAERLGTPGLILTSPLVRTVQTAQLLALALGYEGSLRAHRSLLPDMPVGSVESVINEHPDSDIVLVGHQPSMGALASHLLATPSFPKQVNPGTVIGLERTEPGTPARLLFFAAPGQQLLDSVQ